MTINYFSGSCLERQSCATKTFNAITEMLLPNYVKCDTEDLKKSTEVSLFEQFASMSSPAPSE